MLVLQTIFVLFIGSIISTPVDEFRSLVNEGELSVDDDKFIMNIVPSGLSQQDYNQVNSILELVSDNNEYFKIFAQFIKNGTTEKGLTFNIYDDNMREAAIALFRFLQSIEMNDYEKIIEWAEKNINRDMLSYAVKLNYLYGFRINRNEVTQTPCYIEKPNYFINSETILKALRVQIALSHRGDLSKESKVNQYYQLHNLIVINTNYSGWNLQQNGGDEDLNYFREDIGLNCYYLGIHLLHPFWMSNEELDEINSRNAEHYYYSHQQLMARYHLEKEHLKQKNKMSINTVGQTDYNPYLVYDNGLPFPVRPPIQSKWNDDHAKLKAIDIAIRECIHRGLIIMDNGTFLVMTSDNHINLLAKLIRANLDGVKIAKAIRSLFGNGANSYPVDQYNPAPSILHHPETSLRDPLYWQMIQWVLNYFIGFKTNMDPFDLSQYETDKFTIIDNNFTKILTYFDYYQFSINKAINHHNNYLSKRWPIYARQRRIKHQPFTLNFTIESTNKENVVVRLFLGPPCTDDCWQEFSNFYELDSFNYLLQDGLNVISWSPEKSSKYSFYNDDLKKDYSNTHNKIPSQKNNKYNIFKFPGNLLIPRGTEEGLNLKLFIMITPTDDPSLLEYAPDNNYYKQLSYELDMKPLGFPFHRMATGYKKYASNYQFYDVKIYHNHYYPIDNNDYFPSNLY